MKFISTRGNSAAVSFSEALINGLAPDGGLYIPEIFPKLDVANIKNAADVIRPFFEDDILYNSIDDICSRAFNFKIPCIQLNKETKILELFHGPTSAFKDVGARFLAECFSEIAKIKPGFKKTILVATSGDTGGAVASAFHGKLNFKVNILFPHEGVSKRQHKQLTCWDQNINSYSVKGDFDDCQKMVKENLIKNQEEFSSANSINIGRLLPQMTYYALESLTSPNVNFIIPTGNMGNVVAAFWAKEVGFAINKIAISTNSNSSIVNYFNDGDFKKNATIKTIANAMDVGNPSNIERLMHLYPQIKELRQTSSVKNFSDSDIKKCIVNIYSKYQYISCPHTATALCYNELLQGQWTVVATAHPAKFETVIEPLLESSIPVPEALEEILSKTPSFKAINNFSDI